MKGYVWKDSSYPVFGIYTAFGIDADSGEVDIPDELYKRYIAVEKEYLNVQEELAKYCCE